jgi:hypothetical protein
MKGAILILALIMIPSSGWASTKALDISVSKQTQYALEKMPKAARQALAKAAFDYWQSFDERIPRNSPEVRKWLENELATTDTTRINRVLSGPEYALTRLSQTSEECLALFKLLVENPEAPALTELYLWTKSLYCYRSPNDLLTYLEIAKLSNGSWDGPFSIQHFNFYHSTVTGPLANAILDEGQRAR